MLVHLEKYILCEESYCMSNSENLVKINTGYVIDKVSRYKLKHYDEKIINRGFSDFKFLFIMPFESQSVCNSHNFAISFDLDSVIT